MTSPCWLEHDSGARTTIRPSGLMIGRGLECDLIVDDALASRQHALVRAGANGLEVVCLGRNPTTVNGQAVQGTVRLVNGDVLALPGLNVRVRIAPRPALDASLWVLRTKSDGLLPVPASGALTLGGASDDDLVLPGLPTAAAHLTIVDGVVVCTAATELRHGGSILPAGDSRVLSPDDTLEVGGRPFQLSMMDETNQVETLPAPSIDLPTQVRLAFRPRGGTLHLTLASQPHELPLSERRSDFVAVLLQPPRGYRPGGFVPDAVLFPRVWGAGGGSRNSVNVLINRLRGDLNGAGLPGPTLVERFSGGSATRFALHPNATVQVG